MEIKATKEFWNIYYNGIIQKQISRGQMWHEVEIGMANYKQRIFYEYCKSGTGDHIYRFYRFDDVNNEIIKIVDNVFNHKPTFYPKFGYFIFRGDHEDQDYLCTVDNRGLHDYRELIRRIAFGGNDITSKIVYVGENNIMFKKCDLYFIHDIKSGEYRSFDPNTFSITDNNIYVKLNSELYQFYSYDFSTFDQKVILEVPSTTTITSDGKIVKDGITYEVNMDGTLKRTEMIDYDRILFPLSKERLKIEICAILDNLAPLYKVLLDAVKSYV